MDEKKRETGGREVRGLGVLAEETRTLPDRAPSYPAAGTETAVLENPYWRDPPPHPDPERGCIRRGLCCRSSPGWFAPGEVEQAATLLGTTPDAFARTYLIIDGCALDDLGWVHVFAPVKLAIDGEPALPPLSQVDELYRVLRGVCTFFDWEGCRIYAARPAECRAYVCTNAPEDNLTHAAIARQWAAAATASGEEDRP